MLEKDTDLYRGIQHPGLAKNAEKLIGKNIDVSAFQSTSRSEQTARDFAGRLDGPVLFHIKAKAGTNAIDMDEFETQNNRNENEVLLGRGGKLRVTGVDRSGRIPKIIAEWVGAGQAADSMIVRGIRAIDEDESNNSRFVIGPEEADEIFGPLLNG